MNTPSPTPEIGKIMKEARKSLGLTLERLSERTGVSRSMLSAIERGATNPTFSIVWALSQALGVDLSLLEGTPGGEDPIETPRFSGRSTAIVHLREKEGENDDEASSPLKTHYRDK